MVGAAGFNRDATFRELPAVSREDAAKRAVLREWSDVDLALGLDPLGAGGQVYGRADSSHASIDPFDVAAGV